MPRVVDATGRVSSSNRSPAGRCLRCERARQSAAALNVECSLARPLLGTIPETKESRMKFVTLIALVVGAVASFAANDPFAENVRTTAALAPADQQKTFKLPPGFAIQLVAAEPQLRKPMNMQFDAVGRLWITESREYPWPTNTVAPRD